MGAIFDKHRTHLDSVCHLLLTILESQDSEYLAFKQSERTLWTVILIRKPVQLFAQVSKGIKCQRT